MGIGAAIADEIERRGGRVVVLDLAAPESGRKERLFVECDVRDEAAVVRALSMAADQLGTIDEAYLNAGVGALRPLLEMSLREWDAVYDVNVRGVFLTMREAARHMRSQHGGGSIVVTGSVSGSLADRYMSHYNSSKAAVAMLSRVAAAELGPYGIRVNVLAPGTTDTPLFATTDGLMGYREALEARTPLGGVGAAADVAAAAVDLARMTWVTGQVLAADGGVSLHSPIDVAEFLPL